MELNMHFYIVCKCPVFLEVFVQCACMVMTSQVTVALL